ncbi:MAG: dihydropteroate synthase [Candidatus Edwardsbacteria bacterium]|jgi:dihydropteroate synthase|nr:dihydropteroate synthase [Candidatus Edwardsbacteria bacterium]
MIWRCRSRDLRLDTGPLLMGIVNVTPDSFSDGGRYDTTDTALARALELAGEGADIIDIGGESTRPGAAGVTAEQEIDRVVPVVAALARRTDVPVSVDTYKSAVAQRCLDAGASVINDISGLRFDPAMAGIAARYHAGLVLMHIKGTPQDMQRDPVYEDLLGEIASYLQGAIEIALAAGVERSAIAIDPGIGFGKTVAHNLTILKDLRHFERLDCPMVIGVSRKSFIGKLNDGVPADQRLPGSIAAALAAIAAGAAVLRVHDVAATRQAVATHRAIAGA